MAPMVVNGLAAGFQACPGVGSGAISLPSAAVGFAGTTTWGSSPLIFTTAAAGHTSAPLAVDPRYLVEAPGAQRR